MEAPPSEETGRLDPWTVAAIAVVTYAASNLVHEGLGHGGTCLLVGGRPEELTAVFFDGDLDGLPASSGKWVAAGGSIANLAAAALAWACLLYTSHAADERSSVDLGGRR